MVATKNEVNEDSFSICTAANPFIYRYINIHYILLLFGVLGYGGLPVVIKADLIAAGDQSGWEALTYAAAPVAWGQDIDVPDIML